MLTISNSLNVWFGSYSSEIKCNGVLLVQIRQRTSQHVPVETHRIPICFHQNQCKSMIGLPIDPIRISEMVSLFQQGTCFTYQKQYHHIFFNIAMWNTSLITLLLVIYSTHSACNCNYFMYISRCWWTRGLFFTTEETHKASFATMWSSYFLANFW